MIHLPVYSPSQAKTFHDCARKWAWEKIFKQRRPQTPAQLRGTRVHGHLERWLRDGTPIDQTVEEGRMAFASLHLLPEPGPDLKVEQHFLIQIGRHSFQGFVDVAWEEVDDEGEVIDHKTCTDYGHALTVDTLPDDIQGGIYAAMRFEGFPDCDGRRREWPVERVNLQWNYIKCKKPYTARPVRVTVDRARVAPALEKVSMLAEQMSEHHFARLRHPHDVKPSPMACGKYGGCSYRPLCTDITAKETWIAIMAQNNPTDVQQWLQQGKEATAQQPGAPPMVGGPQGYPAQGQAGPGGFVNPPEANAIAAQAQAAYVQQMGQPQPQQLPPAQLPQNVPVQNPYTGQWEINGMPLANQAPSAPQQPVQPAQPFPQGHVANPIGTVYSGQLQANVQPNGQLAPMQQPQQPQQFIPPQAQQTVPDTAHAVDARAGLVASAPAAQGAPGQTSIAQPTVPPAAPAEKRKRGRPKKGEADAASAAQAATAVAALDDESARALRIGRLVIDLFEELDG